MEVKIKKPDRRVFKTKRAIRNAFAELLSEKDIDKITIKDIADRADINRRTFYSYYSGVYQIIDEIENEICTTLEDALKEMELKKVLENPYEIFDKLNTIINSDLDFYSHLLKINVNVNLASKIIELLKSEVKASIRNQIDMDDMKLEIMIDYSVSGMIAVYQNWFNSDRSKSIEDLAETISLIAFSGIKGLLEKL